MTPQNTDSDPPAMKIPSRSLVLSVVVFLTVAVAAAWWLWPTTAAPTVSFTGFGWDNYERIAIFSVRNPGSGTYRYLHGSLVVETYDATGAALTRLGADMVQFPLPRSDQLAQHIEVIVGVRFECAGLPFRFGLKLYERQRERLAFLPGWLRSWFPSSIRAPAPQQSERQLKIAWSEVVTP
jgi:hypothetical protein